MSNHSISAEKQIVLKENMQRLGILDCDIEETFITGSGSGGQKVNKTSSCVVLQHIPTGVVVKCQKTRYRENNRFFARRVLCEKLDEIINGKQSQASKDAARIRKQKKRRKKKNTDKLSN